MAENAAAEPLVAAGLRSCALSALAALLPDGASSPEAAFLRTHSAIAARSASVQELLSPIVRRQSAADAPLLNLAEQLGLHLIEILTVALAAAMEMDLMCGRAIAHLQAPLADRAPRWDCWPPHSPNSIPRGKSPSGS